MPEHDVAVVDNGAAVGEHRVGFGGKTRNEVGTDGNFGACALQAGNKIDGLSAGMAALHAFEDHVVA